MTQITKFRTQAACRIAHISRDRFNEAVAAGYYPCAPEATRGSTRLFDEVDMIALFYYGQMLDGGKLDDGKQYMSPRQAGHIACHISKILREHPDENEVVVVRSIAGGYQSFAGSEAKVPFRKISSGPVIYRLSIDIENIREIVRHEIQEELNVTGVDDE